MPANSVFPIPNSEFEAAPFFMARALELAARGQGYVEPNPMVGCVLVRDGEVVGEGWHGKFGGAHAEVEALHVAGPRAKGATAYVTLEPCCHQGKTPPCTQSLINAGIAKVVCAQRDPFEAVSGQGIAALHEAGIDVEVGLMAAEAHRLNAPYLKLIATGRPWIIAKWAMTLDGKIATAAGNSHWISSEASRQIVQQLRSRVDGILIGSGTAKMDDPLLIARHPGPRVATRIIAESQAALSPNSQLVQTARDAPVLIAAAPAAPQENIDRLTAAGCEVITCRAADAAEKLVSIPALLNELGRRRMTNVLVEGGGKLLGALFDAGAIDEVHVFIAPKLIGGASAPSPIAGTGVEKIAAALHLADIELRHTGEDLYLRGRIHRDS
ncbi:MAG TPA: bifunctional diaminohydroxyphosphoribosylaminopyrimidine deaminase/5-amino-6-(5-phosphoribosylamino)uracil reductase RibD [Pirellulales bacterium]|jgi:diaminohydroxyphosphoribosylaminopyrimidine deaminase/5-amino-6-(5-phosphoribosylamino)uracil reductase|nr:bifunctional diaminohydroxyphosphoribosylaminopyrimidine deaminase/5-amino-6-(5-phosphoribosylamino)uracil reductase RibD [Pirellulales bacterium]